MIRNALEVRESMQQGDTMLLIWLERIGKKINESVLHNKNSLVINCSSSLGCLFLQKDTCEKIIDALKNLGYYVYYHQGSYNKPRFLLIDWSKEKCVIQEIAEREIINKQLEELQISLHKNM